MTSDAEIKVLKSELTGLFHYIQRVRQEIAALYKPADDEHRFASMSEQLDAIVKATADATNTIMSAMEENEQIVAEVKKAIADNAAAVFEACSFQDITGQRIGKVAKSLGYVEKHVNVLIDTWGRGEVEKTEVKPDQEKTVDEQLLHGPQLEGKGVTQDEIDKLFQ
ncbi:MAG: protein phosphatase CheZ [Acidimicrobiia bacterium]|nr:protein phosphatase CheZ [Acidimicrobiia bacterium]